MTSQYSSRTADKFVVRLPDGVRPQIDELARAHHQSMNSRIICYIEDGIKRDLADAGVAEAKAVATVTIGKGHSDLTVLTPAFTIGSQTFIGLETTMSNHAMYEVVYRDRTGFDEKVMIKSLGGEPLLSMSVASYAELTKGK